MRLSKPWVNMNKEEVWERVLALWKRQSEIPDMNLRHLEFSDYEHSLQSRFKNSILEELGYTRCESGCPFCEEYYHIYDDNIRECHNCPISFGVRLNCAFDSPYADWSNSITFLDRHNQDLAKAFYEWLKEKHEDREILKSFL